ncbi:MAG: glycoside hydrolase family 2 [Clostridia bacterium]|nr:glycoside hydrolase family 2 [Clostridia bacterium]
MRTPWFDKVDKDCPLSEYPRPQLERDCWLCLNGSYDYAITDKSAGKPEKYDGKILVPYAIESELSGVQKALLPDQMLWYRRVFTPGAEFEGKRILLHFTSVDYKCTVWVNGKEAGKHTGGYIPFTFDITDLVNSDENELVVAVTDPTDKGPQQRGKQILKPMGFWYTATSGIWQTVWLEGVEKNHIESLKILPDIDSGKVHIDVKPSGEYDSIRISVFEGDKEIFSGETGESADIPVENARLWSPEDPFLYTFTVTLTKDGACDKVKSYFGMRKFSIMKDGKGIPRLALNNKPYFQRGLLDQGYWPESGLTAPTDEAMIFDIAEMKRLGFNMLRKHIKKEPARWYYHCDRLGMLVWQDMISGGKALNPIYAGVYPNFNIHVKDNQYKVFHREKPEWREEFKKELFELIDSLYNSVSICCWVPFNEGWGQFDAKEIGEKVKAYDPSRFVDHASGWHDQKGPDFKSIHKYVLPVNPPTARRTRGRPIVLSEFGGYQNSVPGHLWKEGKTFGMYLKYPDKDSLSEHYRRLHFNQIKPFIAKGLCATVYTQVSDVECELNGIFTYDRKVLKIHENVLKEVNEALDF